METSFWTISGWVIALLSLIVNYLQLQKNSELKKQITNPEFKVGDHSKATQQTHSGKGNNINVGGDANVK